MFTVKVDSSAEKQKLISVKNGEAVHMLQGKVGKRRSITRVRGKVARAVT